MHDREAISDRQAITTGVPQGSHLGSILFLIFINDLKTSAQIEIYADDKLMHFEISQPSFVADIASLQQAITEASAWAVSWKGCFGYTKTVLLTIRKISVEASDLSWLERERLQIMLKNRNILVC